MAIDRTGREYVANRGGAAHRLRAWFEANPAGQLTYPQIQQAHHISHGRAREVIAELKASGLDLECVYVIRLRAGVK